MADLRKRKQVKIVVVCVFVFGLGIALIAYLKSNARVKNNFAINTKAFNCVADYLVSISENYPNNTRFIIDGDYDSGYGQKINYEIWNLESVHPIEEIPWKESSLPNREQEKAINQILRIPGIGIISMVKSDGQCIISFVFNGNSDNWKEIVYSTAPNRIMSREFVNYSIQESYKYSHEELAPNWVFWYTEGRNR